MSHHLEKIGLATGTSYQRYQLCTTTLYKCLAGTIVGRIRKIYKTGCVFKIIYVGDLLFEHLEP